MFTYVGGNGGNFQFTMSAEAAARLINDEKEKPRISTKLERTRLIFKTWQLVGPAMMYKADVLQQLRDEGANV